MTLEHYLVIVWGDVDPEVIGPLKSYDDALEAARQHREEDDPDMTDGLFYLSVGLEGVKMSAFPPLNES